MTIDEVVRNYVETRSVPIISTTSAVRSIRSIMPNCPHGDRELAELVAQHAVKEGLAVNFD